MDTRTLFTTSFFYSAHTSCMNPNKGFGAYILVLSCISCSWLKQSCMVFFYCIGGSNHTKCMVILCMANLRSSWHVVRSSKTHWHAIIIDSWSICEGVTTIKYSCPHGGSWLFPPRINGYDLQDNYGGPTSCI